jgi:hypothetical protein
MTDEQKENLNTKIAAIRDENYSNYGHSTIFDYHSDTIDSRDIQERIDELQSEFDSHVDEYEESDGEEDGEEYAGEDLLNWLEENGDEFVTLLEIKEEVEQYTSEWDDGAFMIADDYLELYAQELAEDTGAIDRKAKWPLTHIDWDAAAEELKCDYSEVTIAGKSYWIR